MRPVSSRNRDERGVVQPLDDLVVRDRGLARPTFDENRLRSTGWRPCSVRSVPVASGGAGDVIAR